MRSICFAFMLLTCTTVCALDASDFSDLEGWTVAAVTQVTDEFEGCDFDRTIRFDNGWEMRCNTYFYSYAYRPDAVIFVKSVQYQGQGFWLTKVLIDDEFYEMQAVPSK